MKRGLGLPLALAMFGLTLMIVSARSTPIHSRVVNVAIMGHPAAESLANWWDQDSATGLEHGFCTVLWTSSPYRDTTVVDTIDMVYGVERSPRTTTAEKYRVAFECPTGSPPIHTHPRFQGVPNCSPTKMDINNLALSGAPFGAVQCSRDVFQFFFRDIQ